MKAWGLVAAIGVWVTLAGVSTADDTAAAKAKQIWPQEILQKYDRDNDGHLNKQELSTMQADILTGRYTPRTSRYADGSTARRQLDARRKVALARYDADGDGRFSDAEFAALLRDVLDGIDPTATEKVLASPRPKK